MLISFTTYRCFSRKIAESPLFKIVDDCLTNLNRNKKKEIKNSLLAVLLTKINFIRLINMDLSQPKINIDILKKTPEKSTFNLEILVGKHKC